MSFLDHLMPGDVIAVRKTHGTLWSWLIRLGGLLRGGTGGVHHVIVVHHRESDGTLIGVEARPSGVGYVDIAADGYDNEWLSSNTDQPRDDWQRATVVRSAEDAMGVCYDWLAIASDAAACLGVPQPDDAEYSQRPPRMVVCSSLANWCHYRAGLPHPGTPDRWVTPEDWDAWNRGRLWETALRAVV